LAKIAENSDHNIDPWYDEKKVAQKCALLLQFSNHCPKLTITHGTKIRPIWSPWRQFLPKIALIHDPKTDPRYEVATHGKVVVIVTVWLVLIVFTFLYFYFCEWRLFPQKNRLKEMEQSCLDFRENAEAGNSNGKMNKVSCWGECWSQSYDRELQRRRCKNLHTTPRVA
jgi:hypothetical protein